ncbi:MAG: epoxide hydrolase N-terminal domain-containing protein [Thermomicrobiales bacterium]
MYSLPVSAQPPATSSGQALAAAWKKDFDWQQWEMRLNALSPSTAVIDGQPVHSLRVTSPEPAAIPLTA